MRGDLAGTHGLGERRMFRAICFLQHGNMISGVHKGGAMYRVGKPREAEALAIHGLREMGVAGRRMSGFVEVNPSAMAGAAGCTRWTATALETVAGSPPK